MGEVEFHKTGMGRKFFDKDFPELVKALVELKQEIRDLKEKIIESRR